MYNQPLIPAHLHTTHTHAHGPTNSPLQWICNGVSRSNAFTYSFTIVTDHVSACVEQMEEDVGSRSSCWRVLEGIHTSTIAWALHMCLGLYSYEQTYHVYDFRDFRDERTIMLWLIVSNCCCNHKCFIWGGHGSSQSNSISHQCATLISPNEGETAFCGHSQLEKAIYTKSASQNHMGRLSIFKATAQGGTFFNSTCLHWRNYDMHWSFMWFKDCM